MQEEIFLLGRRKGAGKHFFLSGRTYVYSLQSKKKMYRKGFGPVGKKKLKKRKGTS
jgi:hypothetical protein